MNCIKHHCGLQSVTRNPIRNAAGSDQLLQRIITACSDCQNHSVSGDLLNLAITLNLYMTDRYLDYSGCRPGLNAGARDGARRAGGADPDA